MKKMSSEIARMYGIPTFRKFGNNSDYNLIDVYKKKGPALNKSKNLRSVGWLARMVPVIKPHGSLKGLPYKASDYYEYAVYARPKMGWGYSSL